MNKVNFSLCLASAAILCLSFTCDKVFSADENDLGRICIKFADGSFTSSKSQDDIPDTLDFLLTVSDQLGIVAYSGRYGDCPRSLQVDPGTYTIEVRSIEFTAPAFSSPLYGDDLCVVVAAGATVEAELSCTMMNAGLKLEVTESFASAYPDAYLNMDSDEGSLSQDYDEQRIAYFSPGNVSVSLMDGEVEYELFTRELSAKQILSISLLSADTSSSKTISIALDTTCTWINEQYTVGSSINDGSNASRAMDITEAKKNVGAEDVWVYGYIAGCFKSASNFVTEEPFPLASNMAISDRTGEEDSSACLSVELKSGSTLRSEANLVDNPENLGRKIRLQGDIVEAYYGIVGLKNISDFSWD